RPWSCGPPGGRTPPPPAVVLPAPVPLRHARSRSGTAVGPGATRRRGPGGPRHRHSVRHGRWPARGPTRGGPAGREPAPDRPQQRGPALPPRGAAVTTGTLALHINGADVPAEDGGTFLVSSPYDHATLYEVAHATPGDVDAAVRAARAAFADG